MWTFRGVTCLSSPFPKKTSQYDFVFDFSHKSGASYFLSWPFDEISCISILRGEHQRYLFFLQGAPKEAQLRLMLKKMQLKLQTELHHRQCHLLVCESLL